MREHLIRWFSPPKGESPAETLRWVRRISLALAVGSLLLALQTWASQGLGWDTWVLAGGGLLSLSSWFTMVPAIRSAERRGPRRPAEQERARAREDRWRHALGAIYLVTFPVLGYLVLGIGGALFFFVMAAFSSVLSLWFMRRYMRR